MMMRLVAGIVIICGSGFVGVLLSEKFKKRVRELKLLQNAMTQLEFDIDFLCLTLDASLERMSKNLEGDLKEMFLYISKYLQKSPGTDMQRLWKRAITKYQVDLALTDNDLQILLDFSKTLGTGNREKEKNNIKLALMRLDISLKEAYFEEQKNTKMYRGLGFLAGVFLIIVLI